ncbi:hypothetical protein GEMRC1_006508 [Eukaryota sp. GEM-RC1]
MSIIRKYEGVQKQKMNGAKFLPAMSLVRLCYAIGDNLGRTVRCYEDGEVIICPDPHSEELLHLKHTDVAVAACFSTSNDNALLFVAFSGGDLFCFNNSTCENHRIQLSSSLPSTSTITAITAAFDSSARTPCHKCFVGTYSGHVVSVSVTLFPSFSFSVSTLSLPDSLPTNSPVTSLSCLATIQQLFCLCCFSSSTAVLLSEHHKVSLPLPALPLSCILTSNKSNSRLVFVISTVSGILYYILHADHVKSSDPVLISTVKSNIPINRLLLVRSKADVGDLISVVAASLEGSVHVIHTPLKLSSSECIQDLPNAVTSEQLPSFPVGITLDVDGGVHVFDCQNYSILATSLAQEMRSLGKLSLDSILND